MCPPPTVYDGRVKWAKRCCATHRNKELEYWCSVCSVPVCHLCWSHGAHKDHSTSLFMDVCGTLKKTLLEKAGQLEAGVTMGTTRLKQLATLRDEAARREGSVGAAGRALDEVEKQFAERVQALRKELDVAAVSWYTRADAEHKRLAEEIASSRTLAESMRATCGEGEDDLAQRVALEYQDLCRQEEGAKVCTPSLVGCEVAVPAEALAALQKAVTDLSVVSDEIAACALCGEGAPEGSLTACDGCKQGMCPETCAEACLCTARADSLELAEAYGSVGQKYCNQSKYEDARDWHDKARLIQEDKAPGSLDLANTYSCIGQTHYNQSKYAETRDWYGKARLIQEEKAPGSLDLANTYYYIGMASIKQSNYNVLDVQDWLYKALHIREVQAPGSLDLADTYDSIGTTFHELSYGMSQFWYDKARLIREEKAPGSSDLAHV